MPFTGYLFKQELTNNGFQSLTIVAKNFIQILAGVLDPPLNNKINQKKLSILMINLIKNMQDDTSYISINQLLTNICWSKSKINYKHSKQVPSKIDILQQKLN